MLADLEGRYAATPAALDPLRRWTEGWEATARAGDWRARCLAGGEPRPTGGPTVRLTTSVASCFPFSSSRRRTSAGSRPATDAASLVTRTSPAAAADARRAVVLTVSPSTVSSVRDPSPTAPTQAGPVWTPGTERRPGPVRVLVAGGSQQGQRGFNGPRRVAFARQERKEHRDDLVADELVDAAVVIEDDRRSR